MGAVIVPVLVLGGLAWVVPHGLARLLPEGVGWLVVNAVLSSVVLLAVSAGYFVLAYAGGAEAPVLRLIGSLPGAAWHFARLAALAGIIWAPIALLAVAQQPRRWRERVW